MKKPVSALRHVTKLPMFNDIQLPEGLFGDIEISCEEAIMYRTKHTSDSLGGKEKFFLLMHAADLSHEHSKDCPAFDPITMNQIRSTLPIIEE